jgi:glycosyltransferase involved in cell wall biosynthesis
MKKVIFFFEADWAFGSVHYELFKYLWNEGYNCHLLPWNKNYTVAELQELDRHVDFWVTSPHGYRYMEYIYQAITAERVICIAHAPLDINELIHYHGFRDFARFRNYGVVSEFLKDYSISASVERVPMVCPVAINYHTYYSEPSKELKTIGFAGTFHEREEFTQEMIEGNLAQPKYKKRGYLVREIAEKVGLNFVVAQHYHNSFITMGGFYKAVDCVIMASTEEGAGLPVLEAGAAGKLVIGTPVGHWPQRVKDIGGIQVPIPEKEFVDSCVEILTYYKNRPAEYRNRCAQIQEHAKTYDWSNYIQSWVDILQ